MDKMIKVSPGVARLIKSFVKAQNNAGNARTSLLPANGMGIGIRDPKLARLIKFFVRASNQVKSSPLSLRSADNANYSDVQALQDRIAKLTGESNRHYAEKQYLQGRYDQQKKQGKDLLNQNNDLLNQNNDLSNQVGVLREKVDHLKDRVNDLKGYRMHLRRYVGDAIIVSDDLINKIKHGGIDNNDDDALRKLDKMLEFLKEII